MRNEVDVESNRNIGVICNKTQLLWYQSFIKSIKREKSVYTWVETQTAWRGDLISEWENVNVFLHPRASRKN